MPFRPTFDCLWCGRTWHASGETDLTGWAALCQECLERAQDNSFLRYRVRTALRERSGGGAASSGTPVPAAVAPVPAGLEVDADMRAGHAARAAEDDDWYQRRGRFSRGPARDLAWHMELDAATTWLDGQPFSGEIVELAAGTGWWSPLLAGKGVLSLYDTSLEALDRARERLTAHRLRAHIHERDPGSEPDRQVDGLFCGFWLGRLTDDRLGDFLALVARWLRPGGRFAFIDSLADPEAGAVDAPPPGPARTVPELIETLGRAGFVEAQVITTPRFFVMGTAVRPE